MADPPPKVYSCLNTFERAFRPILLLVILLLYTYFGAYVMHVIEERHEVEQAEEKAKELNRLRAEYADKIDEIHSDEALDAAGRTSAVLQELKRLEVHLLEVDHDRYEPEWTLWTALHYSASLYTTIGYGDVVPATGTGRAWTVVYALVGIPLALLVIAVRFPFELVCERASALSQDLGRLAASVLTGTWQMCCRRRRKWTRLGPNADLLDLPVFPLMLVTLLWVLVAAVIFIAFEQSMDFGTAIYFIIISLTTIGLGDVMPEDRRFMMLALPLVLIGMALFSTLFQVLCDKMEAVFEAINRQMDDQYLAVMLDGEEFGVNMAEDPAGMQLGLARMVHQLPWSSSLYYRVMPGSKKAQLEHRWQRYARRRCVRTQTDEFLMRGGPTKLAAIKDFDNKSRDDVNSLVAMCDWSL